MVRNDYSPRQVLHLRNVEDRRAIRAVRTSNLPGHGRIPTVAIGSSFTCIPRQTLQLRNEEKRSEGTIVHQGEEAAQNHDRSANSPANEN